MVDDLEQKGAIHGASEGQGSEFTLCGMAFDSYGSGDHYEPIVFARKGERITCERCLRVISFVYENYTANGKQRHDVSDPYHQDERY